MNLYEALVAAGCEIDHHESDLYVKDTLKSRAIVSTYASAAPERFRSALDGCVWLDIPFAYAPFWGAR